ncbi:TPA: glycosyltransferase family 25 protein [Vibrio parahaemolyticus]|nr:glycosyltransferase [Vibrio alginolyticus]HCE4752886.1 glycosyltransferase family 25 protein [Vibrio parahaemolyticus]HCH2722824.1 glycosyltransferase family 25 protein [Vibrio parahaemolyticus]HCM0801527.1 glycosyltransferase family 25 protein [Vibrio parahaemolyticus]
MKVFVLSLKQSTDRRKRVEETLNLTDIEFEFFDALTPQELSHEQRQRLNPEKTRNLKGYELTEGETACFFSHMAIWQWSVKHGQDVLVLEDNVDIHAQFTTLVTDLKLAYSQYMKPRTIIKLSASKQGIRFKKTHALNNNFALGNYVKPTTGAMGYLMSSETAQSLVEHANEIIVPVDDYMEKVWIHRTNIVSVYPNVVSRAVIPSTIGHVRKSKTSLTLLDKINIETFRLYEQIRLKAYLLANR